MKFLSLVLIFISYQQLQAQPIGKADLFNSPAMQKICAGVVTPNPKIPNVWNLTWPEFTQSEKNLFSTYKRDGQWLVMHVTGSDSLTEIAGFNEPIRDLVFVNGRIFVLLSEKLVIVDPELKEPVAQFQTHDLTKLPSKHFRAHSMAHVNDYLAIAHGAMGLVLFDLQNNTFTSPISLGLDVQGNGHVSKATGVAEAKDGQAVVVVEAVTVSPRSDSLAFNGLMKLDLAAPESTTVASRYDHRASGVLSYARIQVTGDTVYINNFGVLQVLPVDAIDGSDLQIRHIPIGVDTDYKYSYTQLMGDTLIEDNTLYGCGMLIYRESMNSRVFRKGLPINVLL